MLRKLLALIVFVFVVSACAARHLSDSFHACAAGERCMLRGTLELYQGAQAWAALLISGDGCAKLALPEDFYEHYDKCDMVDVEVIGKGFVQPSFAPAGQIVLWYTEQGRKVARGMCDGGIGVFVWSIRSKDMECQWGNEEQLIP